MGAQRPNLPFRWDVSRPEQLGSLATAVAPRLPFLDDLVHCAGKVLARSRDGDVVFVGRSAENLLDYTSAALAVTDRPDRVRQLPFSLRQEGAHAQLRPRALTQLRANLTAFGVTPQALADRDRPLVLADLVVEGNTFGNLVGVLHAWAWDERIPWDQVRRRLRLVGVTPQCRPSPRIWRWQQHHDWVRLLPPNAIVNVALDSLVWSWLANWQPKTNSPFTPQCWEQPAPTKPPLQPRILRGIANAAAMDTFGRSREGRQALVEAMTGEPAFREAWLRTLVLQLRRRTSGRQRRDATGGYRHRPGRRAARGHPR